MAGASLVPFHGDESTLIFMGRDTYYLFVQGDLSRVLYDPDGSPRPLEQHLRLVNGTVSKFVYGWLADRAGYAVGALNDPWNWRKDFQANLKENRHPDAELLRLARLASSLQLALAVAAYFAFVRLSANRPTAYLASALFTLNPTVLLNGRRAMMEGSHLLGAMLVLLAAAWLLRERKWWKYALLGIFSGFAIAAKHPNAIIVALTFLAVASRTSIEAWASQRPRRTALMQTGIGLVAAALLTAAVFLMLNPAWWRSPVSAASETMSERLRLLRSQVADHGGYESTAEKVIGFWRYVFVGETLYFEAESWARSRRDHCANRELQGIRLVRYSHREQCGQRISELGANGCGSLHGNARARNSAGPALAAIFLGWRYRLNHASSHAAALGALLLAGAARRSFRHGLGADCVSAVHMETP